MERSQFIKSGMLILCCFALLTACDEKSTPGSRVSDVNVISVQPKDTPEKENAG